MLLYQNSKKKIVKLIQRAETFNLFYIAFAFISNYFLYNLMQINYREDVILL